jgi:hypothetical protein
MKDQTFLFNIKMAKGKGGGRGKGGRGSGRLPVLEREEQGATTGPTESTNVGSVNPTQALDAGSVATVVSVITHTAEEDSMPPPTPLRHRAIRDRTEPTGTRPADTSIGTDDPSMDLHNLQRALAALSEYQANDAERAPQTKRGVSMSISSQDPPGTTKSIQFTAPQVTPATQLPSRKTFSSTTNVATEILYTMDAYASAPWNQQSFFFGLLHGYLKFPDDFLVSLQEILQIADTSSFLEFFGKPRSFVMRLPMSTLQTYHDQLYQSWLVTKFFLTHLHLNEDILLFASEYDDSYSPQNNHHCQVIGSISRFIKQNLFVDQEEFQKAFEIATRASERVASSFEGFNSRLGRQLPTTPTPPIRDTTYQCSPVVEPISQQNPFSNLPPYARVGSTYEPPSPQRANHSGPDPYDSDPSSSDTSVDSPSEQGVPSSDDDDPSKNRNFVF